MKPTSAQPNSQEGPLSDDEALRKRFQAKLGPVQEDGCQLWKGSRSQKGYGVMILNGRKRKATHVAMFLETGRWPRIDQGEFVLHKCHVRHCCRPGHLKFGTHQENMRDMLSANRQASKLQPELLPVVWETYNRGWRLKTIARIVNVSVSTIRSVLQHRSWLWLPCPDQEHRDKTLAKRQADKESLARWSWRHILTGKRMRGLPPIR